MTTWNESWYCPELVASADDTGAPHSVHLKFVVLGGLGQLTALAFTVGSRSRYILKAEQPDA